MVVGCPSQSPFHVINYVRMRFHALLLVRDEADVIEESLRIW